MVLQANNPRLHINDRPYWRFDVDLHLPHFSFMATFDSPCEVWYNPAFDFSLTKEEFVNRYLLTLLSLFVVAFWLCFSYAPPAWGRLPQLAFPVSQAVDRQWLAALAL